MCSLSISDSLRNHPAATSSGHTRSTSQTSCVRFQTTALSKFYFTLPRKQPRWRHIFRALGGHREVELCAPSNRRSGRGKSADLEGGENELPSSDSVPYSSSDGEVSGPNPKQDHDR